MGRAPCCDKANVKRGPWSPEEDATLTNYLNKNGTGGNWISLPQRAGLKRCGKSCRLRWLNYLRPDIKHGAFSEEEDNIIISLYSKMGSRWSVIAANLPGRTDNDVKNHWNTKLKKRLFGGGVERRSNTKIKNVTFTNHIINPPNLNYQPPNTTSSSTTTPTPSPSPPSPPSYLDPNPNYSANLDHNHFYNVTISSFSDLLAQCTTNNVPMSTLPLPSSSCYNSLFSSSLDPPPPNSYVHNPMTVTSLSSSSCYSFDQYVSSQARMLSQSGGNGIYTPQNEVSSITSTTAGIYHESNNMDDNRFLSELGFGLFQEAMVNSTSNYGDQEDIKPQVGQGVTNY